MGMLTRLVITAIVSSVSGAGLWAILQIGAGIDPGIASGAAAALAAMLAGLGAVWAAQPPAAPAQGIKPSTVLDTGTLKGVKRYFTDRVEEWAWVRARVRAAENRSQISEVFIIYGMPGVGKSEFAQYAAHGLVAEFSPYAFRVGLEMLPRQVELHGLEGVARTDPRDALHALLDLDGSDLRRATMNLDDLSAEWRKHLQGKFLILVLDNADSEDQILPFLPGGSSFILLITSRRMLRGMTPNGIAPRRLKELPQDGAVQMIKSIVARPLESEDQEAIEEIVRMFGCHPKALTLAVSNLAWNPEATLAGRLTQLKKHPNLLLAADEYADKGTGGTARSFDLSYTQLPDAAKLVLRRLALAPVPAVSVEAAVALADLPGDVVSTSLHELAEESLIEEDVVRESYKMHDLIRHYSRSLARDDPTAGRAAINRMLAYYRDATARADALLTRQPAPTAIEPPVPSLSHNFADRPSVIRWVRAELPNLLACVDHVVQEAEGNDWREENSWVVLFACALAGILRNEGQWRRSIELQGQAVKSAGKIHLPLAVANALSERGMLYRLTAELESAVADLERAISIYQEVGGEAGQTGEAHALNTYGVVLDQLRERDEGRRRLSEALGIYRRLGDNLGEANILHDQGMAEFFGENYESAVQLLRRALELYKAVDHPLGMAHAHSSLARAEVHIGAQRASADNLESARVLYRDLGNRLGEINVMVRLGQVLREHDRDRAEEILNEAVGLSVGIGNQLARINALDELGEIHAANGDMNAAADTWSRALEIASDRGIQREVDKLAAKIGRVR